MASGASMSDVREHKRVYKLVEKWSANRENGLAIAYASIMIDSRGTVDTRCA